MGMLDMFKRKKQTEDETTEKIKKLNEATGGNASLLQQFEEKTGLKIVIQSESKREKQKHLRRMIDEIEELEKVSPDDETIKAILSRLEKTAYEIALIYGRGGDNPTFQKAWVKYSRIIERARLLPALLPWVRHATRIILGLAQYDKDVASNTPIVIKKEYPELPKFTFEAGSETGDGKTVPLPKTKPGDE